MSISDQQGGPAFPFVYRAGDSLEVYPGMTLRDYFAAQALAGMLSSFMAREDGWGTTEVVGLAYDIADAMLAEREKARGE